MARILPTDKFGSVYYGPKTFKEGELKIEELNNDHWMSPKVVIDMMREAGYIKDANKLAEKYL